MRVLGIVCSPRKEGNTEILVKEVLSAAGEAGAQTDLFLIAGKRIEGCDSCGSCHKTGICQIQDDMQSLYPLLEAADAIILGSPVYFQSVTSQAKAVMDRTYSMFIKKKLKGKVAAPVLAVRRIGGGQTRNLLYSFFIAHGMIPVRGAVGYGRQKGEVIEGVGGGIGVSAMEEARATGKEVVEMLNSLK